MVLRPFRPFIFNSGAVLSLVDCGAVVKLEKTYNGNIT